MTATTATTTTVNQSDADSPAPRRPFRVAIMGAGIAGLSAALALRHFFPPPAPAAGHPGAAGAAIQINIYEKATQLREIGASIALNPSGLRILDKLGVAEALRPDMAYRQPSGHPMVYLHWQTSEVLGVDTYRGAVDEERHSTARFHRAHLQAALLRAVQAHGSGDDGVDIRLGKRVQTVESRQGEEGGGGVRITFADGSTAEADMVLGADGIHSPTRRAVAPAEHEPVWTGQVALRATFDAGRLPDEADVPRDAVHIVGHDTTMFASYLGKNQYTIVGNHFSDPHDPKAPYHASQWDGPGDVGFLKSLYKGWSPLVQSLLSATPYINTYPNYAGTPLPSLAFAHGRIVLLGDAAHTHGGAFAAGGSLAINDAYCLARALAHAWSVRDRTRAPPTGAQMAHAAALYDATRRPLVTRVLDTVHGNARAKRAAREQRRRERGRAETDGELRARVAGRPDLSWLTEHDVDEAFGTVVARLG